MFRPKFLSLLIFFLFIIFFVCDNVNSIIPDDSSNDNQPAEYRTVFGSILVSLIQPQGNSAGYTSVLGKAFDGPSPDGVIWEEAVRSGNCRLLTPRVPFCNNPCDANTICVEDDKCQAYPSAIDMGTVTVTGLLTRTGDSSFSMDPVNFNYQPTGGVIITYPPFSEGDEVNVIATGASGVPAFTISARGIAPLKLLNDSIVLEEGKPVQLKWTPPAQTGNTTIHVMVDVSHHGGTKGKIECECEDSGSLEISDRLIDGLLALGVSGFPKLEITRKAEGSTDPATVDLVLESKVTKELHIPGLISCNCDEDCPDGQTCQPDLKCGE
jgi:hypothetical protein